MSRLSSGEKKTLKMEEEISIAFVMLLISSTTASLRKQGKTVRILREQWMRLIF